MEAFESLAQLLRTDKDIIRAIDAVSSQETGTQGSLESVEQERRASVGAVCEALGIADSAPAQQAWMRLEQKIAQDEDKLKSAIGVSEIKNEADWRRVLDFAYQNVQPASGWFLKKEKARQFLEAIPPEHVIQFLGYRNIQECLAREDVSDVFASMRFGEDAQWLNGVFFKQYESLVPDDFEQRAIELRVLPERYAPLARHFIEKKYHNLSHLKELGVLFVIPVHWQQAGQFMKVFTLSFHYLYEIQFYADITKRLRTEQTFTPRFIAMLRGDTPEPVVDLAHPHWLMTQRYLEKEDQYEIELAIPHVNPESIHWAKAQDAMAAIAPELQFWKGKDWVGAFFKDDVGEQVLVSFNVVDAAMSLADAADKKYTYHQREAMWNRIYTGYFGAERLEEFCKQRILE